ncbi:GNAT family N-acetyltransferase [Aurantiacibacter rhizosphaerae]|uniref:GNAT family N-acetyltransferase n=1 Tax=Aurantiacibacter rhizosphaerae TaxID=2691582 RepID=A0A844XGS7_9SPHN|nr:GNAT family N-acetyltransferase [Aurantiacibacter rhizosphaerae]MWV28784.1 GNAT family N-acetyltransferase [Aurantiacibacter rhizosphaerae]
MEFRYKRETVTAAQFADLLHKSGLAQRRPVSDFPRLQRMLDNANLIVTARLAETGQLVGIARSITDWSYATYLSDLAVDAAFKGRGIGRRLIEETRTLVGEEAMLLLISAPDAVGFYQKIGMPVSDRAFLYPQTR